MRRRDEESALRVKITRLDGSWEVEIVMIRDRDLTPPAISGVVKLTPSSPEEVMAILKHYLK